MLDDLRRNYVFNPQNGLVIRPYKCALPVLLISYLLRSFQGDATSLDLANP
jgi:hypothetical protein